MKTIGPKIFIGLLIIASIYWLLRGNISNYFYSPSTDTLSPGLNQKDLTSASPNTAPSIETVSQNLDIPWEVAFGVGGSLLVTERPGKLLRITAGQPELIQEISGVNHTGEGGLLGLALHPDFKNNSYLYLYLTSSNSSGITNRIERYVLTNNQLSDKTTILEGIKGAANHDGGRIAFGPDGYLYVGTGDAQEENLAQDTSSLNGKILRIKDDGTVPTDNPFGNAVYSYGHRNVQGLAWDNKGNLWATEHGPSGDQTGNDELNLIKPGSNYGWPLIKGSQTKDGMITPIIESGSSATWAPAGMAFYNGSLFFAGLRGESLYEAKLDGNSVSQFKAHFSGDYGRLRAVSLGSDNMLYITTSNTDGRGDASQDDDKIIRINPEIFYEN